MKVNVKAIRACWVEFEYLCGNKTVTGKVLIDFDKLKVIETGNGAGYEMNAQKAAASFLENWKRSKEIAYNKRLKAWHIFTSNKTVRFGRAVKAQNVQAWFSGNEIKVKL